MATWLCVERFAAIEEASTCHRNSQDHPVRLLTIVRHVTGSNEHLVCLSVVLCSRTRDLIVCTQERHLGGAYLRRDPCSVAFRQISCLFADRGHLEGDWPAGDGCTRFSCPELAVEDQWRHVVLVFQRSGMMKHSSVSLFVDGTSFATQKASRASARLGKSASFALLPLQLNYISANIGASDANPNANLTVYAYVGTPPCWRRQSNLRWQQGPLHFIEEPLTSSSVQEMHQLGPNYVGSFQTPPSPALYQSEIYEFALPLAIKALHHGTG